MLEEMILTISGVGSSIGVAIIGILINAKKYSGFTPLIISVLLFWIVWVGSIVIIFLQGTFFSPLIRFLAGVFLFLGAFFLIIGLLSTLIDVRRQIIVQFGTPISKNLPQAVLQSA